MEVQATLTAVDVQPRVVNGTVTLIPTGASNASDDLSLYLLHGVSAAWPR